MLVATRAAGLVLMLVNTNNGQLIWLGKRIGRVSNRSSILTESIPRFLGGTL